MLKLQLYIEGEAVELFDDESVSLTQTIQNVRDISKIFTDFSKTFNVPASKINNKIFKHFYNYSIVGFDAGTKKSSEIYLNHQLFKKGKIKLEGASLKAGKAHTYRITFFGDTINMKDLLSDDKIGGLDILYDFNFEYNSTNVINYLQDGLDVTIDGVNYPDAVIIPLITHTDRLFYDSTTSESQSANLYNHPSVIQGVKYEQLKPAVRVYALLKGIEKKYGLRFSGDFFNASNDAFYNLYLWLHRKEGGILEEDKIRSQAYGFTGILQGTNNDKNYWRDYIYNKHFKFPILDDPKDANQYFIKISTEATNYNVIIERDGEEYERLDGVSGNQELGSTDFREKFPSGNYRIFFESESSADFQLEVRLNFMRDQWIGVNNRTVTFFGNATVTTQASFEVALQTPEIKVLDLVTGLFKMFNLTAFQDDSGEIVVKPLDEFYGQSKNTYDITPYLDTNASTVDTLMPYRRIRFSYKGTESFFSENHKELFGYTWGEEKYDGLTKVEGDTYELELPFEHHKFERLIDTDGTKTDVQWGWSVDIKQETYLGEPFLFYAIKITNGTEIGVIKTSSSKEAITDYYIPSNSVSTTASQNLNFKAEINEYALEVFDDTLYKTYYDSYIADTFKNDRRLSKYKATLPLKVLLNFTLADRFVIYDRLYKINTITTDLSTGISDLELINEVRDSVVEEQDKYFADTVDKRYITCDSDKVTVDWTGTI